MLRRVSTGPATGTVLAGKYRLDAPLGAGSFGNVFRATLLRDGSRVALKVMSHVGLERVGGLARARREAELGARLQHPNAVRVLDAGDDPAGWFFIALELLEGRTVEEELERLGPMSPRQAALVVLDVLSVLEAAHAIGIVHRDLKPANLFLVPVAGGSRVKVLDFGLAKSLNPGTLAGLTRAGTVLGTPLYMPPEQILGEDVSPASDLFALGLVLVELVAPGATFEGDDAMVLLTSRISGVRPPIPRALEGTGLVAIVTRATELDARKRFATAAEMRDAILAVLSTLSATGLRGPSRFRMESESTVVAVAPRPVDAAGRDVATRVDVAASETFPAPGVDRAPHAGLEPRPSLARSRSPFVALVLVGLVLSVGGAVGAYFAFLRPASTTSTTSTRRASTEPTEATKTVDSASAATVAAHSARELDYAPRALALVRSHTPIESVLQLELDADSLSWVTLTADGRHEQHQLRPSTGELGDCAFIDATEGRRPIPLDRVRFGELLSLLDDARRRYAADTPKPSMPRPSSILIQGAWIAEGRAAIQVIVEGAVFQYGLDGAFAGRIR